jgi:hypothetical protein
MKKKSEYCCFLFFTAPQRVTFFVLILFDFFMQEDGITHNAGETVHGREI